MKNTSARRVRRLLLALSSRLFAAEDETARRHGWEIKPRRGGWARTYRDPRFASLASDRDRAASAELAGRWP
ncbi:MAG: hypothetical protein ACRDJ9_30265 [Dehalococcoidia bacterium]